MKRDVSYIRQLLLEYEADEDWQHETPGQFMGAGRDERRKHYHVLLMMDAGLLAEEGEGSFRVSNSGHDYLEAIRDEGIWKKTKAAVAETGGSATLEIIKSLATGFLKNMIAKHTGIAL